MIGKIAMATVAGVIGVTAVGSTAKADECDRGYGYGYGYVQPGYYGGYAEPYYRERRFEEGREARREWGWRHRGWERRRHFWGWGR